MFFISKEQGLPKPFIIDIFALSISQFEGGLPVGKILITIGDAKQILPGTIMSICYQVTNKGNFKNAPIVFLTGQASRPIMNKEGLAEFLIVPEIAKDLTALPGDFYDAKNSLFFKAETTPREQYAYINGKFWDYNRKTQKIALNSLNQGPYQVNYQGSAAHTATKGPLVKRVKEGDPINALSVTIEAQWLKYIQTSVFLGSNGPHGPEELTTIDPGSLRKYWPEGGSWLVPGRIFILSSSLTLIGKEKINIDPSNPSNKDELYMYRYRPELTLQIYKLQKVVETVSFHSYYPTVDPAKTTSSKTLSLALNNVLDGNSVYPWKEAYPFIAGDIATHDGMAFRCLCDVTGKQEPPNKDTQKKLWEVVGPVDALMHSYRDSFFMSKKGLDVISRGLSLAKAHLQYNSREFEVEITAPFWEYHDITTFHVISMKDPQGLQQSFQGKVKSYELYHDAKESFCKMTLACFQGAYNEKHAGISQTQVIKNKQKQWTLEEEELTSESNNYFGNVLELNNEAPSQIAQIRNFYKTNAPGQYPKYNATQININTNLLLRSVQVNKKFKVQWKDDNEKQPHSESVSKADSQ